MGKLYTEFVSLLVALKQANVGKDTATRTKAWNEALAANGRIADIVKSEDPMDSDDKVAWTLIQKVDNFEWLAEIAID